MKTKQLAEIAEKLVDQDRITIHAASLRVAKAVSERDLIKYINQNPEVLDTEYGNVPLRKVITSCITKDIEEQIENGQEE